ncbi:Bifunctional purine biosynthetic protein ade1 [Clydaea vesicula]|uniref:Phosphoribosylaminoimidazole-succinocarboxamide synthase n=1 Tax=Clydaea vesicula TaxID=447962 RepID=A0AAD5Y226_9FUNG|nr:Bifunctional purine biosynthetic protein ade1 [Clydaea vesicula]KAJ3397828.1 Bifunctional purine biosynthetic protein ade1 [Lobulomyces angularis]
MNDIIPDLKLLGRGKVRDVYEVDEELLLFVASDRLSAFDVVMKNGIKNKGKILTQLSEFWFKTVLKDEIKNHLVTSNVNEFPEKLKKYSNLLEGRSMLVRKLKILPVEAIVRGYITGSGWSEYQKSGTICQIKLPEGLKECQKLEKPLFTPSTKAEIGDHDENIHPDKLVELIGEKYAKEIEEAALKIYIKARDYALTKGIIIADTKFEFGLDKDGCLVLADEVLTPDSSRFWPLDQYQVGKNQPSFDKQFVRDWLLASPKFDKVNGLELPNDVIDKTMQKYLQVFKILTGKEPTL